MPSQTPHNTTHIQCGPSNSIRFIFSFFVWFVDVCEAGWSFFNGSCYLTSETCETWTNATTKCRGMKANLVSVQSQEENVFIQHHHNGDLTWIGLNDIAREGFYSWVDGSTDKFRFWAKTQPNNFGNQDCVHTLGIGKGYAWNDIDCSACHNYTCEKGNTRDLAQTGRQRRQAGKCSS